MSKQQHTTTIENLHTDSRVFSVDGDDWRADVTRGKSVRIYGIDANTAKNGGEQFDRTYEVGGRAVCDSYNLVYTGEIVSITEKTVTVSTGSTTKRLPLAVFVARNRSWSLERVDKHNAEELRCI